MEEKTPQIKAVALEYDSSRHGAPIVSAKGRGLLAERIIEVARESGVPLYRDPDLTEVLMAVDLDDFIPGDLYQAVAEVLAFVYRLNQERGESAR